MEAKTTFGRKKFYTTLEPTKDNMHLIIKQGAENHYLYNFYDIDYLINYFKGNQPILSRTKVVRTNIANKVVMNYAWATVRDITGYFMGTPVQYVLKSGDKQDLIQRLNNAMSLEHRNAVDKEVEDFASICGFGYKCTLKDKHKKNEVPFNICSLDPRSTFIVHSTDVGNPAIVSVNMFTYQNENDDTFTRYVAYTDDMAYEYIVPANEEINQTHLKYSNPHLLGNNPIVMYENNQWLMGDFEMATALLDAINTTASNSLDDVEQVVQAILLLFGIDKDQHEELRDVQNGDMLVFSGQQGIVQDGKYIVAQLDGTTVSVLREYLEEAYRTIVGVPDRKTRGGGGGDTGDAVKLRDGWADIELVARNKEMYWQKAEMQSIRTALNILHQSGEVVDLSILDVDIKFSRNKNDNLQSKVQAGSILNSMGVDKTDVATAMDITTDISEFVKRWEVNEAKLSTKEQNLNTE